MATLIAIGFVVTVSLRWPPSCLALAGVLVVAMFRLAAAGRPLHHEFAHRAAAVDGEMVDVVGNLPLVWSFCGLGREHSRLDTTIDRENDGAAAQSSLSGKAPPVPCGGDRCYSNHRAVGMGHRALAERNRGRRATWCWSVRSAFQFCTPHAISRWRWWIVTQHLARLSEALATLLIPPPSA